MDLHLNLQVRYYLLVFKMGGQLQIQFGLNKHIAPLNYLVTSAKCVRVLIYDFVTFAVWYLYDKDSCILERKIQLYAFSLMFANSYRLNQIMDTI